MNEKEATIWTNERLEELRELIDEANDMIQEFEGAKIDNPKNP